MTHTVLLLLSLSSFLLLPASCTQVWSAGCKGLGRGCESGHTLFALVHLEAGKYSGSNRREGYFSLFIQRLMFLGHSSIKLERTGRQRYQESGTERSSKTQLRNDDNYCLLLLRDYNGLKTKTKKVFTYNFPCCDYGFAA